MKFSPILRRSAQTPSFSEPRGRSYGPKRLSSLVSPSVRRKDDSSPPLRSSRRDSPLEKKIVPKIYPKAEKPLGKLSLPCFPHPPFKVTIKPQSMHQNANPTVRIERRRQFQEGHTVRSGRTSLDTRIIIHLSKQTFSPDFLLSSTPEVAPQSHEIRELGRNNMTGAIIPALMHRIPSELRS